MLTMIFAWHITLAHTPAHSPWIHNPPIQQVPNGLTRRAIRAVVRQVCSSIYRYNINPKEAWNVESWKRSKKLGIPLGFLSINK